MKKSIFYIVLSLVLSLFFSCNELEKTKTQKLSILTTTNIIADGVRQIVGDKAEVISLMGAGVDPHLYKASQGDIEKLSNADVIVYNGLHLEGKMTLVLEKLSKSKTVIAISDGISSTQLIAVNAHTYDPHIWFDIKLWQQGITHLAQKLAIADPANKNYYLSNTEKYIDTLKSTDTWIQKEILKIPKSQRVIITAHDAFSYYGRAYDIEVKGLQGISTLSDFGLADITRLLALIVKRNIKSVFIESSVSPKSVQALIEGCKAQDHAVILGGTLYSDALGAAETKEGSYLGILQYNTITISKALQ